MTASSGFYRDYVRGGLFLGTMAIAVLAATYTTAKLEHWSNRVTNHELQLAQLQSITNRLDALEWRAIAQRRIDVDLQISFKTQRKQSEAILTQLQATASSPAAIQKVLSAYDQYVQSVNQLLHLLETSNISAALEVDENKVDPSYNRLREIIAEESVEATNTAQDVGNQARLGSLLTSLVLIAIISAIFRQYHQANRRAQSALLEQESMRRSEQALKQERELLEIKVIERTQELEEKNAVLTQALVDLKQAQIHLIQSEKMSSLGQLVAGVAHEINNPVSFIHGNVSHAVKYTQDLLQLIELYQNEYSEPNAEIAAKIKAIDLNFLKQDIQKLFKSMDMGTSRIQTIVLSLRNFSRLDETEFKAADLHEGIDNTLIILGSRLKARDNRPPIQIRQQYGNLHLVECYAGQLNQVFMNIFINAIDAIDSDPKHQNESAAPAIAIHTERLNTLDTEWVRITISDNGIGMSESTQHKLFEPFFTTKPVGKGTGLGMSISYQVITHHHGHLYCQSALGKGTDFVVEIPVQQS